MIIIINFKKIKSVLLSLLFVNYFNFIFSMMCFSQLIKPLNLFLNSQSRYLLFFYIFYLFINLIKSSILILYIIYDNLLYCENNRK